MVLNSWLGHLFNASYAQSTVLRPPDPALREFTKAPDFTELDDFMAGLLIEEEETFPQNQLPSHLKHAECGDLLFSQFFLEVAFV